MIQPVLAPPVKFKIEANPNIQYELTGSLTWVLTSKHFRQNEMHLCIRQSMNSYHQKIEWEIGGRIWTHSWPRQFLGPILKNW